MDTCSLSCGLSQVEGCFKELTGQTKTHQHILLPLADPKTHEKQENIEKQRFKYPGSVTLLPPHQNSIIVILGASLSQSIAWYQLAGIGVAVGMLQVLRPTPHTLSPSLFPTLPRLAPWWPSAGSAPRKPLTGVSSATSSWPGL